jgi:hypothetical protein
MSSAPPNLFLSDLDFASEWDSNCRIGPKESLDEWLSDDEDSDLNMMDFDQQIAPDFFVINIFDDEPLHAQLDSIDSQLDSMDLDLESDDDYFMRPGSPVSSQSFPFPDNTYREAFKNLAESMKRSQETRASLKLKPPVKKATQHWEERKNSISTVLTSTEKSSRQIQQTYFQSIHA